MSKDNPTLQDLFVTSDSDRQIPELRQAVDKQVKVVKWDVVEDVLADKVLEMIDIPLLGVLVSGWKKYREVEDSEEGEVSLAAHTFKSEHHPYLEILVKGVPVGKLNFTVLVELILEGFVLAIKDGKIMSVQAGRMKGQGSIALENSVIVEKEFGTVELPGRILLGAGIPLDRSPGPQSKAARPLH